MSSPGSTSATSREAEKTAPTAFCAPHIGGIDANRTINDEIVAAISRRSVRRRIAVTDLITPRQKFFERAHPEIQPSPKRQQAMLAGTGFHETFGRALRRIFQIDDGWQLDVGDWVPNARFPSGMEAMARRIEAAGFLPGLWLAPFLVRPSSRLYRERPEWLLRDAQGRPVLAGFNWGDVTYALAAARDAVPDAYILACGAPILASLGIADALRVGPDSAPYWEEVHDRPDRSRPAALNALRTTLHRLWLLPLLHIDPDVVYFRSRDTQLTPRQRALLHDLALITGYRGTSDPPAWLDQAEREALHHFLQRTPRVRRLGRYRFELDDREADFSEIMATPSM